MPHQAHQRTFSRKSAHRAAMFRNLTLSVLRYERVKTTEPKAKEIRRFVDRMINLGKDGTLAARRRAVAFLPEREIVEKVFSDLAARYPDRTSGYTRIVRLGRRVGDSAPMMLIELVPGVEETKAAEAAKAEPRPRRRLGLPRRRRASGTEPSAEAAADETTTERKTAKTTKATKTTKTAKTTTAKTTKE